MSKRVFGGENQNIPDLVQDLTFWFQSAGFETQSAENEGVHLVQARKASVIRTFLGTNQAFHVKIEGTPSAYSIEIGTGKWMENLAGAGLSGLLLTGGITWITAGVNVAWVKKLENDLWSWVETRNAKKMATTAPAGPAPLIPPSSEGPAATPSIPEQIKKLAELRDMGILSPDEFETKKKELLSRM